MSEAELTGTAEEPEPTDESLFQSDERRLIARELHDSTSQLLAALQMQLCKLRSLSGTDAEAIFGECNDIAAQLRQSIRDLNS